MAETTEEKLLTIRRIYNDKQRVAVTDFWWMIEQAEKAELLEKEKSELLCELGRSDTKLLNIKQIINE